MMTVGELRELIEGLEDGVEVRLAIQPQWAFEYSIGSAVLVGPDGDQPDAYGEEEDAAMPPAENVLYLTEGTQLGYLPGYTSRVIGWK
jgi:hypothetical protein